MFPEVVSRSCRRAFVVDAIVVVKGRVRLRERRGAPVGDEAPVELHRRRQRGRDVQHGRSRAAGRLARHGRAARAGRRARRSARRLAGPGPGGAPRRRRDAPDERRDRAGLGRPVRARGDLLAIRRPPEHGRVSPRAPAAAGRARPRRHRHRPRPAVIRSASGARSPRPRSAASPVTLVTGRMFVATRPFAATARHPRPDRVLSGRRHLRRGRRRRCCRDAARARRRAADRGARAPRRPSRAALSRRRVLLEERNRYADLYARLSGVEPIVVPSLEREFAGRDSTKCNVVTGRRETRRPTRRSCARPAVRRAYVTRSMPEFIEVMDARVDKGKALALRGATAGSCHGTRTRGRGFVQRHPAHATRPASAWRWAPRRIA